MVSLLRKAFCIALFSQFVLQVAISQTSPTEGIRTNTPTVHAFTNARIVQAPGKVIQSGTLVVRDGVVQAVGSVTVPPDARVWDMKGMTIYPGLIDSYSDYGMPKPPSPQPRRMEGQQPQVQTEPQGSKYWNDMVKSQQNAVDLLTPDPKAAEKLRAQGVTTVLSVPTMGVFKGASALVNLGEGKPNEMIVRANVAQHITLNPEGPREGYPNSLMGVIALIRQTLLDAGWYQQAQDAYRKNPGLPRPEVNEGLAALRDVVSGKTPVVMDASDELNDVRADKIAREFSLDLSIRGSGYEYRRLEAVRGLKRSFILPLNFPEAPQVQTPGEALQISLAELRHWDEAPENPQRLDDARIDIAFCSALLKESTTLLGQARKAVGRGLAPDVALAALTTNPARMFGVEKKLGSLEVGALANFVVCDGDLFAEKTNVRETWIDGKRYEVKPLPEVDPRGKWSLRIAGQPDTLSLTLKGEPESLQGSIVRLTTQRVEKKEAKLKTASLSGLRLSFSFGGDSVGYAGIVRMTAAIDPQTLEGTGEWGDGTAFAWTGTRAAPYTPEPDTSMPKKPEKASFPPVYPAGEFGRPTIPDQPASLFIQGGRIWTSGPQGIIENGSVLIERGKISKIGTNLTVPKGAVVIHAEGKHVTAGLIDAHSHTAVSGSVNESGQAITAEVRIGDVIDCDDIDIYRELAGGLTEAHVLHGSANPIGGQCQLIKLRWGMLPDEMKFDGAPPTIKFALGENVKQSNWGERFTTRYPQTRMGVEQIMRDEFKAARDYERAWQKWERDKSGMPPRRDLELETILEVLKGKRFVHCHSYRQDEILATMRVAEDFGFRIQAFQHILEGYKVADIMAQHGVGGSTFSDWWAYKLEVYDAIPYNGPLMHDQGVVVSFNSDSDELARRLNNEAAKAVKYGGLSEEEALKFVTINPAKQLRVESRVGSLEAGKDADFVIWSGNPLSSYSRCEQTWIDGRKFFDRDEDRKLYAESQHERAVLVQKALAEKKTAGPEMQQRPPRRGGGEQSQEIGSTDEASGSPDRLRTNHGSDFRCIDLMIDGRVDESTHREDR